MTLGRVLYVGGARSGKSQAAERRLAHLEATYVATSAVDSSDPDWESRVRQHRARRPTQWRTIETLDLPTAVANATTEQPVLIDCLTLWLSRTMDDHLNWSSTGRTDDLAPVERAIDDLATALSRAAGSVVVVSNEVGSGIVPEFPSGRLFRDLLGSCNARIAAQCDEVNLVVAGCVLPIKPQRNRDT